LGLAGASSTECISLGGGGGAAAAETVSAAAAAGKATMTKKEKKQAEKQRKKEEKEAKHKKEVEEGRWIESTSADGRITTAYLKQPGSKGTIGLRGQVRKKGREQGSGKRGRITITAEMHKKMGDGRLLVQFSLSILPSPPLSPSFGPSSTIISPRSSPSS
jgi:hypothetical protein